MNTRFYVTLNRNVTADSIVPGPEALKNVTDLQVAKNPLTFVNPGEHIGCLAHVLILLHNPIGKMCNVGRLHHLYCFQFSWLDIEFIK